MTSVGQYDYEGLIKSYLLQDRLNAKTATNRMSYKGKILYSYETKLAQIYNFENKILLIDGGTATYSHTSIEHDHKLKTIAKELNWQVFVIDLDYTPSDNLREYWKDVEDYIGSFKRSRMYKEIARQKTLDLIAEARAYAKLYNLNSNIPKYIMEQLFINKLLT